MAWRLVDCCSYYWSLEQQRGGGKKVLWGLGDHVYVCSGDRGSATRTGFGKGKGTKSYGPPPGCTICRIDHLWRDRQGRRWAQGPQYYLPQQTVHPHNMLFFKREVRGRDGVEERGGREHERKHGAIAETGGYRIALILSFDLRCLFSHPIA